MARNLVFQTYYSTLTFKKILFICLRWVCIAARRLSLVAVSWGYSSLLLWSTGSRRAGFSSCGSWALEHRLSSCGLVA